MFAASVDTPETNKRFAQTLDLDFPVLSDPDRKIATAYGVAGQGGALRWTFYIGTDGRILYIDKQVNATAHGRAIARQLAELGVARRSVKGN